MPVLHFFYDYVDPASYLLALRLEELPEGGASRLSRLEYHPFELRRPPRPMLDPGDPRWVEYLDAMTAEAERLDVPFVPPDLVPWSRKAHELALHSREKGCFEPVHRALFGAYFAEGRDIGRVDVLVELATDAGLDRTETKAALDVDRHLDALVELREAAERSGVRGVPTLRDADGTRVLEGYPDDETLDGFLEDSRASR